jgi:hypothetical protein
LYQESKNSTSKKFIDLNSQNESLKKELKVSESNLRRMKEKLESFSSSEKEIIKEFVCNVLPPKVFHLDFLIF